MCTRLMFYQSVVTSVIVFAVVRWGCGTGTCGANKLGKLVGMELDSVEAVTEKWRMREKLKTIMDNPSHPVYAELRRLRSTFSLRLIQPCTSKR